MKTSSQRLKATKNRTEAVKLRSTGMTLEQIGNELGVSTSMAFKYIQTALEDLALKQFEETQEYRALQMLRLEGLLSIAWKYAEQGDLNAIDKAIKITDQLSKLMNLYAPIKIAQTNLSGDGVTSPGIIVVPAVAGSVEEWLEDNRQQA